MLKINIFWAVFKKPLRMRHCFLFGPYFMPFFNGQILKCDILLVSNDPIFIIDLLSVAAFLLPIMVHDNVWCRFPSELKYLLETHYITLLEKVLLQLRHRWLVILSLASGTYVSNVVRRGGCCIVPLD